MTKQNDPNEVRYIVVENGLTKQQAFLGNPDFDGLLKTKPLDPAVIEITRRLGYRYLQITREEAENYLFTYYKQQD